MPGKPWGVRSIPEIDSRYPLWDQPNFVRDVDEGRFYLPDAEEGKRETLVTSVIDAQPHPVPARAGADASSRSWRRCSPAASSSSPPSTGGGWRRSAACWRSARSSYWLWTGTARIPEKEEKDVGLGLTLPLYASGPASVGWWAMFITMLGDVTAFVCLVFGYFFYWTIHDDFPPEPVAGPGRVLAGARRASCCSARGR